MIKRTIFLTTIILQLQAASSSHYPVLAVPGQNGSGSSERYVASQLGIDEKKLYRADTPIYRVNTPSHLIDFGQRFCQKDLNKGYAVIDSDNGYMIHATSQGTATALNFLAANPKAQRTLKGLVLEAVMASGNSAIAHNVHDSPLGHILAPYIARLIQFWAYSPSGMQAIKSIENLQNKDLPIVLVHSTNDRCLPYYGACALYYRLKEKRHRNVYLVTKKDSMRHIEILNESSGDRSIVKSILAQHDLVAADQEIGASDLIKYQPDHMQYRSIYEKLCFIEKAHTAIGATLSLASMVYFARVLLLYAGICQTITISL